MLIGIKIKNIWNDKKRQDFLRKMLIKWLIALTGGLIKPLEHTIYKLSYYYI